MVIAFLNILINKVIVTIVTFQRNCGCSYLHSCLAQELIILLFRDTDWPNNIMVMPTDNSNRLNICSFGCDKKS